MDYTKPNAHVFYWCDESYIWLLQQLFLDNDIKTQRVCLWIKNNFTLTPQVAFNKAYEPCVYGVIGKPFLNKNVKNQNEILNKDIESGNQVHEEIMEKINIWLDKLEKKDDEGEYKLGNKKPVTLLEKPLKRCSAPGHVVVDLFGDVGSTIIACEQIKRQARVMEQDPIKCDVIVDRWEKFTNLKAKKYDRKTITKSQSRDAKA